MGRAAYGLRGTKQTNAGTQSTETPLAFTSAIMHTAYTCTMHRIPEHVVRSHSNFVVGHGKPYTTTFTILACPTGRQHRQTSRCVLERIITHDYITCSPRTATRQILTPELKPMVVRTVCHAFLPMGRQCRGCFTIRQPLGLGLGECFSNALSDGGDTASDGLLRFDQPTCVSGEVSIPFMAPHFQSLCARVGQVFVFDTVALWDSVIAP